MQNQFIIPSGVPSLSAISPINYASGVISFAQRVITITSSTAITIDSDVTDLAIQANTETAGTLTINAPTGTFVDGQKLILRLTCTNIQTLSWDTIFAFSTDLVQPLQTTGAGKTDYLGFQYFSSTNKWHLLSRNFGF